MDIILTSPLLHMHIFRPGSHIALTWNWCTRQSECLYNRVYHWDRAGSVRGNHSGRSLGRCGLCDLLLQEQS